MPRFSGITLISEMKLAHRETQHSHLQTKQMAETKGTNEQIYLTLKQIVNEDNIHAEPLRFSRMNKSFQCIIKHGK